MNRARNVLERKRKRLSELGTVLMIGYFLSIMTILGLLGSYELELVGLKVTVLRCCVPLLVIVILWRLEAALRVREVSLNARIDRADQRAWSSYLASLYDNPEKLTRLFLGQYGEGYVQIQKSGRCIARMEEKEGTDSVIEYCIENSIPHMTRPLYDGIWTFDGFCWSLLRAEKEGTVTRIMAYDPVAEAGL